MTTTIAVLQEAIFATSGGTAYTSKDCITVIDTITATNESAAIATATAQLISPDGTMTASYSKPLQPGTSWPFPLVVGQVLAIGGKLNMVCPTSNTAIRWRASGRQFT